MFVLQCSTHVRHNGKGVWDTTQVSSLTDVDEDDNDDDNYADDDAFT